MEGLELIDGHFFRMVSFGIEDFVKRYGALKPSQFVDVVALAGDKSDNIPGSKLNYFIFCPLVMRSMLIVTDHFHLGFNA